MVHLEEPTTNESASFLREVVTATLAFILIVAYIVRRTTVKWSLPQLYLFPPGPRGLPLLGNFHQLAQTPAYLRLSQWADEFGALYKIRIGASKDVVVVNDSKIMKEIFGIYPASTGKFNSEVFLPPFGGNYGLNCLDGSGWLEQREFCFKTLKTFGLGKGATIEPLLMLEINDLVTWIEKKCSSTAAPMHLHEVLQKTTFSTLWLLVTGERVSFNDIRLTNLVKNELDAIQKVMKTGLVFFPALKYLAPEKSGYNAKVKAGEDINRYVSEYFKQHQSNFVEGTEPQDLVYAFLDRMSKEKDPLSTFYGEEGWKHCVGSVVTLFLAGAETLASTINWMIFYLCVHPEAQKQLQEEILSVVGRERDPNLMDKLDMPYTDAVILETLRLSSAVPLGLLHKLTEDLRFKDYFLPKGTILLPNLYYVHHNPNIWGDPEAFRPERFLCNENTRNFLKENVVAFQVGKRQCLGEPLARDALFMFIVKLFQKFSFHPDTTSGADKDEYMKPDDGYILLPKRLRVSVNVFK